MNGFAAAADSENRIKGAAELGQYRLLRAMGTMAMGFNPAVWRSGSAERARVLLICPHCGQETPEYVDELRGMTSYDCRGDGCDYRFDLTAGAENFSAAQAE